MTRNNDTTYRQKGRAVFLAAIMVLSVFAMSVAFTGSAAAEAPEDVTQNYDDALGGELVEAGQRFAIDDSEYIENASVVDDSGTQITGDTWYLVRETGSSSDTEYNTVRELSIENSALQLDTSDLEGRYVISSSAGSNSENVEAFTVNEQTLTTDWDDDAVDQRDAAATLEFDDSVNSLSNRNISVRADGLSYDQLVDLFAYNQSDSNVIVDGEDDGQYLPYNTIPELDEDDRSDDELQGVKDEDVLTLNLTALGNVTNPDAGSSGKAVYDSSSDEIYADFKNLAEGEGLPERDDYEFEFFVTDTTATDTASLEIGETDPDVEFEDGVLEYGAGDVATMEFTFEEASEGYLQIGGPDVDFVDIVYVEAEDPSEPVTIRMNSRTAGANESASAVYDEEDNVESLVSANQDGWSALNGTQTEADSFLVDGDGDRFTNGDNEYAAYLEELDIIDDAAPTGSTSVGSAGKDDFVGASQLTRPMQPAEYDLTFAADITGEDGVFEASNGQDDPISEMNSGLLRLTQPEIGDVTTHVAPRDDADDTTEVDQILNNITTQREDVAIEDRLVVQVEATGLYGTLVNETTNSTGGVNGFDLLDEGESVQASALGNITGAGGLTTAGDTDQGISISVEADTSVGNQEATQIDFDNRDPSDTAVVIDNDGGQFFVITDTSEGDAFSNGDPSDGETYTAEFEYDSDTDEDRYEFTTDNDGFNNGAFDAAGSLFPYFSDDRTETVTQTFTMENGEIAFDNVNEDQQVQVQNTEDAEISGTTNVAPGSDAEIRASSTSASTSFREGSNVDITEDGSITATFDFSGQEVGDEFDSVLRVDGSQIDSQESIIVEAVGDGDGEETNETDEPADDGEEEEPADDGETNESTDDGDESTDDGTPGFGAVVALIALIGAALLAVRRQN